LALEVQIRGANQLKAMADALRKADREDLRRGLDRAIRKASKPTVQAIKESAEHINTRGIRKPGAKRRFTGTAPAKGTRKKIAEAVGATVSTAGENPRVSFQVRSARLPETLKNMPRKFDSGDVFRHPVMGNTDVWVGQTGDPWFFPPIKEKLPTFRAEIDKELDVVREKLERA
jgi:hypothetical protein